MKRILLASTAIVAFAGAAAADGHLGVTFSGSATLGYNDTDLSGVQTIVTPEAGADNAGDWEDSEFGFYSDLSVTVGFAAELDNGLTAAASIDLEDLADGAGTDEYTLSLTSETAGLHFGSTETAAATHWVAAGDMAADGFSNSIDGSDVLRGDVMFGGVNASVSYIVDGSALEQLSVGAAADFGNFNVVIGYQEAVAGTRAEVVGDVTAPENFDSDNVYLASGAKVGADFNANEIFGLSVGTTFGAADVRLAFADDSTETSTGLSVTYPFGPVSVSASYVDNSVSADVWDLSATYADGPISVTASTDESDSWALEGSYDVGNGLTVLAGVADAGDDYYVAGTMDLGSGANLLVSYAVDSTASDSEDEIGANDYQEGATVELSFAF